MYIHIQSEREGCLSTLSNITWHRPSQCPHPISIAGHAGSLTSIDGQFPQGLCIAACEKQQKGDHQSGDQGQLPAAAEHGQVA